MNTLNFVSNLANIRCRANLGLITACAVAVAAAISIACQGAQPARSSEAASPIQLDTAQLDTAASPEGPGSVAQMPGGSVAEEAVVVQGTEGTSQPEPTELEPMQPEPMQPRAASETPAIVAQPQPEPPTDPAVAALAEALQQAMLQSQTNGPSATPLEPVPVDLSSINIDLSAIQQMMNQMVIPQGTPGSSPSPTNGPR